MPEATQCGKKHAHGINGKGTFHVTEQARLVIHCAENECEGRGNLIHFPQRPLLSHGSPASAKAGEALSVCDEMGDREDWLVSRGEHTSTDRLHRPFA